MQIALDECNANLIRLQASSVTGVEYPVHGRAPAVPGPALAPAPEPFEVPKKAAKPTVGRKEAARAPADAAEVDEAAAPAPAPAAAPKQAAHSPIAAPEKKAVKPAVGRKEAAAAPAVAPKQEAAANAPAAAPAAAEAAFQVTEARSNKKKGGKKQAAGKKRATKKD